MKNKKNLLFSTDSPDSISPSKEQNSKEIFSDCDCQDKTFDISLSKDPLNENSSDTFTSQDQNAPLTEKQSKKEDEKKHLESKESKNLFAGLLFLMAIGLIFIVFFSFLTVMAIEHSKIEKVSFEKFIELCEDMENIVVSSHSIKGELKDNKDKVYTTDIILNETLFQLLKEKQIGFSFVSRETPLVRNLVESIVHLFVVLTVFVFIYLFVFKKIMFSKGSTFKNRNSEIKKDESKKTSRLTKIPEKEKKIMFSDIAGCKESKFELMEIVEYMKDPSKFNKIGAKIPKGILLTGVPGTGKTMLARAAANEADSAFFSVSGSDFVEMFVGLGAMRMRSLFAEARRYKKSLVFIDEIEVLGKKRVGGGDGGTDERDQTLNQLLVEMDGFEQKTFVSGDDRALVVIGATNMPECLDKALVRPGRFDRIIVVDVPDVQGRKEILEIHMKDKRFEPDLDLYSFAASIPGFTGADIANLVNEALILATREGRDVATEKDLKEAIEKVVAGPKKESRAISFEEKEIIAWHEAGHAVAGYLAGDKRIHKISILPRGYGLGYTMQFDEKDILIKTEEQLKGEICTLLGGRAAEEKFAGVKTTGAALDYREALSLAKKMCVDYAMVSELFMSDDPSRSKDYMKHVNRIISEEYERATALLSENKDFVKNLKQILIEKETVDEHSFKEIAQKYCKR